MKRPISTDTRTLLGPTVPQFWLHCGAGGFTAGRWRSHEFPRGGGELSWELKVPNPTKNLKVKTHRIWPNIFFGGVQNQEQEKIKINTKCQIWGPNLDLRGPNSCLGPPKADMSVDPKVGSMIPEDLPTKCSIGSMIQLDPMVKLNSRSLIPLDPSAIFGIGSWIPSDL